MSRTIAYIGLGSNIGDRKNHIDKSLQLLGETPDVNVGRVSTILETEPLSDAKQPKYLNCVAEIKTSLPAEKLFHHLVLIENTLGRKRDGKWASRTIDLDLLLFGDEVINSDTLRVPHSQMHLRSFVLKGLRELNPRLEHPVFNETVDVLAGRLNGGDFALRPDVPQLIGIAGNIGAGKTTLAKILADAFKCRAIFEAYDTNPFLAKVYAGNHDLALDSQLYFLFTRYEQLNPTSLEKGRAVVTDYLFQKEQIYAKLTLNTEQLTLYQKYYSIVSPAVTNPVVVIYLQNPPQQCLERIHKRSRPYEQRIESSFLEAVGAGYKKLIADWTLSPVITLTDFDCLNQNAVDLLACRIEYYINPPQADKPTKYL
ncbi:MAG: 2-amino-4-hydroxy-6-hydroxymethyldihydropteridine diphosphokinase [Sedimentisphaerales bacterium]|jgi:2-amino-4-hydroxy-6-hydroxymethyldihydropteridine diphosphokinase